MLASGVVAGVLAGWLSGGRPGRLAEIHLAWWPILLVALVLRFSAPTVGDSFVLWIASFVPIAAIAAMNYRIAGMPLIAVGAMVNLLVVLLNQAMPVDVNAAVFAGADIAHDGLHRALRDGDALPWLTDRIPMPVIARVYSLGDVFLAIGGFWVPFAQMRRRA